MYAPNSSVPFSPTNGIDIWAIGLLITGIASQTGAINLIVTALNMRTKGMSLMRMPVFTWMILVIQFLLLFAIPVITVALFLLIFQRQFDATFFTVEAGADPLLWQHLFWIFGHPEVYILVLPSFGIVSEVLPVFSKKPLFGYPFVVFSGAAIGFVGWGVWAHHMFASGLGPVSVAVFSVATMAIAIPTGVKIVNWTLTMWGGKLWFTTAMLFAIGLVVEFTIGGLSGVTHAVAPSDTQQTDTYYIVAHFHYVLFGGAVLGLLRRLLLLVAEGVRQVPQRDARQVELLADDHRHEPDVRTDAHHRPAGSAAADVRVDRGAGRRGLLQHRLLEPVASIGALILAIGVLMFIINIVHTHRKEPMAPLDPWDARTLEWMTTSPPKEHNFDALPTVHALDEFFHRKYEDVGEGDHHDLQRVATAEEILAEQEAHADHHIHLPSPSYWPLVLAFSLPIIGFGVIYNRLIAIVGVAILLLAAFGWALEPSVADDSDYDPPSDDEGPAPSWPPSGTHDERPTSEGTPTPPEEKTPGHGAPGPGQRAVVAGGRRSPRRSTRSPWAACPSPGRATTSSGSGPTPTCSRRCPTTSNRRRRRAITRGPTARPGCPTTRWPCGCSSAPSASCSAA